VEGVDVDRIARPGQDPAVRADDEPGELLDLAAWRMVAGQPFREEQRHLARFGDGDRLLDPEDAALGIGRVDVEQDRTGIGRVLRGGDRVDERHRLRCGVAGGDLRDRGKCRREQGCDEKLADQGKGLPAERRWSRCKRQKGQSSSPLPGGIVHPVTMTSSRHPDERQDPGLRAVACLALGPDVRQDDATARDPRQLLPSTLMVKASTPMLKTNAAMHWPSATLRTRRDVISTSEVWKVMPSVKAK
jgi:hypothetical protein